MFDITRNLGYNDIKLLKKTGKRKKENNELNIENEKPKERDE